MTIRTVTALIIMLICCMHIAVAATTAAKSGNAAPQSGPVGDILLTPPDDNGPVVVHARFDVYDINEINMEDETFEFTGVLTLRWLDPRLAFDPALAGVDEKIYQGDYQFNEVATGWYPQLVLVNESGLFDSSGVILRIQPDGTSTLIQTLNANAESQLNMNRFPFDEHHLEAIFEVLGFDRNEVVFQIDSDANNSQEINVWVPQWTVKKIATSVLDYNSSYSGRSGVSSTFVLSVDVKRQPFYTVRLVVIPLIVIVLLSFSVFWMDRSSLGDRVNVSFIGILTGVAYFLVTSDQLPRISYVTLIHGFLNLSFLIMCATVVINLIVGAVDKRGKFELGDRIDRGCRWIFPLVYFILLIIMFTVAMLFF